MSRRGRKAAYFTLEGLNAYSTALYVYYLFFFLPRQFGFDSKMNLAYAAMSGAIYTVAAYVAGRFGQKYGCLKALMAGFAAMAAVLSIGAVSDSLAAHTAVFFLWTIGSCFTWPALEAIVTENETGPALQRMVGVYNLVWAGANALAYFTGGALVHFFGPRSSFVVPCVLNVLLLGAVLWMQTWQPIRACNPLQGKTPELNPRTIARIRAFLRMAWLANPCAYMAINTVIPVIPHIAGKLGLSTMAAGFVGSVWFFARWLAFVLLWRWPGWHYHFGWLAAAYACMAGCFVILMFSPNIALFVMAQALFGLSVGLIYYSSLYYSMEVGETKSEHGGIHEAAIGLGNFIGPAVCAAAMHISNGQTQGGALAVTTILFVGFAGVALTYIREAPALRAQQG